MDLLNLVSHDHSVVTVLHMIAKHDMGSRSVLGESHVVEVVSSVATRAMGFATLVYRERTLNQHFVETRWASQVKGYGLHNT